MFKQQGLNIEFAKIDATAVQIHEAKGKDWFPEVI
jgi:hypothetical protein